MGGRGGEVLRGDMGLSGAGVQSFLRAYEMAQANCCQIELLEKKLIE